MEKYFVNYNQALALKKLGFKGVCLARFFKVGDEKEIFMYFNTPSNENTDVTVIAPLKSQVFEWFRENYNNNTCISWRDDLLNYDISLTEMKKGGYFYYKENFNNYEEAESNCIDKLIEIIKNK